jgi:regulator of replication initiation timing
MIRDSTGREVEPCNCEQAMSLKAQLQQLIGDRDDLRAERDALKVENERLVERLKKMREQLTVPWRQTLGDVRKERDAALAQHQRDVEAWWALGCHCGIQPDGTRRHKGACPLVLLAGKPDAT